MSDLNKLMFLIFVSSSLIMWKLLNFNNFEILSIKLLKQNILKKTQLTACFLQDMKHLIWLFDK